MNRDLTLHTMAPCNVRAKNGPIPVRLTTQRAHSTEGFTLSYQQDYIRFLIIMSQELKRSNLEKEEIPWTRALREQWRCGGRNHWCLRKRLWLLKETVTLCSTPHPVTHFSKLEKFPGFCNVPKHHLLGINCLNTGRLWEHFKSNPS